MDSPSSPSSTDTDQNQGLARLMNPWRWNALLIFLFLASAGVTWFFYEIGFAHTSFRGTKEVEVPAGYGSRMIGGLLKEQGVIESKWAFVVYATLRGRASDLKPGAYVFLDRVTIPELTQELVLGETNERALVIPEGWNLRDIGRYLEKSGVAKADDFWHIAGLPAADYDANRKLPRPRDFSDEFSFLKEKPAAVGLEGYLFPDTYRVYKNASLEDIIRKMLANFNARMDAPLRAAIAAEHKSLFDVLTVASLVEAEVPKDDDRSVVAGIIWKRLDLGMPLQVDATLTYIRGHDGAPPTAADKALNSRFNTYLHRGLPLGPIANPGLSAVRAAIYPRLSPYLYYLSAPDGTTVFSKTLDEHLAAQAKYLR